LFAPDWPTLFGIITAIVIPVVNMIINAILMNLGVFQRFKSLKDETSS
jgi:hypothetical protein